MEDLPALTLIESLFQMGGKLIVNQEKPRGFPMWISKAFNLYQISLKENQYIYLLKNKNHVEYENLVNARDFIERKLEAPVLIIADDINPKFRSLFVRFAIPFVYLDKAIFAPALGVKIMNFKSMHNQSIHKIHDQTISPFELKLLAGFLTDQLNVSEFNINEIQNALIENNYFCSRTKISNGIVELIEKGFIRTQGKGPNRVLDFIGKDKVWNLLNEFEIKKTHVVIEEMYQLKKTKQIYSNESALSRYSNLAEPSKVTHALTNKEYKHIKDKGEPINIYGLPQLFYEIRKEDPTLFSIDGCLNPIELYFNMHNSVDERIQIALDEMLDKFSLKNKSHD